MAVLLNWSWAVTVKLNAARPWPSAGADTVKWVAGPAISCRVALFVAASSVAVIVSSSAVVELVSVAL